MRIDRERVRRLFIAAGHGGAAEWTDEELQQQVITATPTVRAFRDPDAADYAEEIHRALADGEAIIIVPPGAVPPPPRGVVENIIEMLTTCREPMDHAAIHEELCRRFPDRNHDSLWATVKTYVPSRLRTVRFLNIRANARGYYIEANPAG